MFLEEKVIPRIPVAVPDDSRLILLAAADYMDWHGWCQGAPSDSEGRVCVGGAINHVTGYDQPGYSAAYNLLKQHLDVRSVAIWNDETCQTKAQAIAALMGAANR